MRCPQSTRPISLPPALMGSAAPVVEQWRDVGTYTGRILKGDKPGDLPVQLPLDRRSARQAGFCTFLDKFAQQRRAFTSSKSSWPRHASHIPGRFRAHNAASVGGEDLRAILDPDFSRWLAERPGKSSRPSRWRRGGQGRFRGGVGVVGAAQGLGFAWPVLEQVAGAVKTAMQPHSSYDVAVGACVVPPGHCGAGPVVGKAPREPEQIFESLFGVDKVERTARYTRLSRVGVEEDPQVPGKTATEPLPVAWGAVVSWTGDPPVTSPSSCT
jgi:hypothetical protein